MAQEGSSLQSGELSLTERLESRRLFNVFSVFNTGSYLLLSGNIITLYLLRLGASSSIIGFVSSFTYISFFFMFLGRQIVEWAGVARLFAACWTFRYLSTIPMLFSPIFIGRGMYGLGFGLIIVGTLGFQVMRGVGMVSNSPIVGDLSEGKDRGDYLSKLQVLNQTVSVLTGVLIAVFLSGGEVPLSRYSLFILVGITTGLVGSLLLFRLPAHLGAFQQQTEAFVSSARRAFSDPSFKRFMSVFAVITFLSGMSRPFIIVYAADVFKMSDGATMYLSVIGSLGALAMGFVAQLLLDRLGAKPILVFFTGAYVIGLVPFLLSPRFSGFEAFLFLSASFFVFNFGSLGQENASQTYFYAKVKPEDQLNFGILYFFTFGVGGTSGSLVGGFLLDALTGLGLPVILTHRIFFGLLFAAGLLLILPMYRLEALGSFSVRSALSVIFSARDLRAVVLLNKLDRTTTIADERKVIEEIGNAPSGIAVDVLIRRLKSPSFAIRTEALRALEGHREDPRIVKALIAEVKNREFTTAYRAARILGMKRLRGAETVLRETIESEDYLLKAEGMAALGRIKDVQSRGRIEACVAAATNPLLVIYGAEALKLLSDLRSLPVLFSLLERDSLPEDLREHLLLSIAGILGMEEWFYPAFTAFLEKPKNGIAFLLDAVVSNKPEGPFRYKTGSFRKAFLGITEDVPFFRNFLAAAFPEARFGEAYSEDMKDFFLRILDNAALLKQRNVRFLLAAVFVRNLPR